MASTILHELKKTPAAPPDPAGPKFPEALPGAQTGPGTRPFWTAVFALAAVSVAATAGAFFWRSSKGPAAFTIAAREPYAPAVPVTRTSERFAERHYHVSRSSRPELAELILEFQGIVERESDDSAVVLVPAEGSAAFWQRMGSLSGIVEAFGEPPPAEEAADPIRMTVYFE
jgi:hypothetical protein